MTAAIRRIPADAGQDFFGVVVLGPAAEQILEVPEFDAVNDLAAGGGMEVARADQFDQDRGMLVIGGDAERAHLVVKLRRIGDERFD